jgi:hypothetical protein
MGNRKPKRDISQESAMIDLKRMIREGKLDAGRTLDYLTYEAGGENTCPKPPKSE